MKFIAKVFLIGFIFLQVQLFSQGLGMPPRILAVLSTKILGYVENFPAKSVTVIYPEALAGQKDKVVQAFTAAGLKADAVSETNAQSAKGDMIVLLPGLQKASLASLPVKKHLVISASKADTDNGTASFSIVNVGGKPKIMVNLKHIQLSELKVSGKLYRVAQKTH